ncbi:hypothetical protein [Desulforegula conservatrix]
MTICCKDCGIKMSREKYGDLMDDYLEELLAFIPVDRI